MVVLDSGQRVFRRSIGEGQLADHPGLYQELDSPTRWRGRPPAAPR
jgi:hypothetical protein